MHNKKWFVVDEENNVFAGPIKGIGNAAKIADSISTASEKRKFSIIEQSRLDKLRKEYIDLIISEHNIFHKLSSKK